MSIIYLYFVLAIVVAIIATLRGRAWWRWLLIALFLTPVIAGLLVMVLPHEPRPYPYPDEGAAASLPQFELEPADCVVRIIRLSGYSERHRQYEIFINGVRVGIIARDSVVDFAVPCGQLVIEARTSRGGSRPLLIDATPEHGTEIELTRRSGLLVTIWAEAFGSDSYLVLQHRTPATARQTSA